MQGRYDQQFLREVANRQTNKQTLRKKHDLVGGLVAGPGLAPPLLGTDAT